MSNTEISGFYGDYRFLSNFYPCKIIYEGLEFQSSEALYMGHKSGRWDDLVIFSGIKDPKDAKKLGRRLPLVENWDDIKNDVMLKALRLKFSQNPELGKKLVRTGDAFLEEANYWGDVYWGVYRPTVGKYSTNIHIKPGQGTNWLGYLLMQVRRELVSGELRYANQD